MKKIFLFLLIFSVIFNSKVFAEENIRTISVSGEGIVETSPDMAKISVGIIYKNKDASKVQAESARIASNIINSIVALGIERKNIHTGNYNFRQVFRRDDKNRNIFDGYEVTNSVTITVENIKLVGKIIDTSLANGANNIDSLQFGLKNKKNFQLEAIQLAVRDAKLKAEIIARELGRNIIGVKNVSVNSASIHAPRYNKVMMTADSESFETPIESGNLNCSANVHIEFEID